MIFFDKIEKKYGMLKVILIQIFVSFLIGIIVANLTKGNLLMNKKYIDAMVLNDFSKINRIQLLIFVLQKRVKAYLLIWMFSVTILAVPYNMFYTLYRGFTAGFVVACFSSLYGIAGFLQVICLGLPHMILFIPVFIATLMISYNIHKRLLNGLSMRKGRMMVEQLPAFILLLTIIIIGCFLETFMNPVIIEWFKTTSKL